MRLIDANALREIMYHNAFEEDSDLQRWDSGLWIRYKMFEQALEEIPTIDAEPVKRGRWVIEPGIGCKCSACGFDIGNDLDFMEYVKYCPSCGAKMEV